MEKEIILKHIQNAQENSLVDFKRDCYDSLKNSDFPKDIMAFANNCSDDDKYIIFGVEDKTRNIVGINPELFFKQDDIDAYVARTIEPFLETKSNVILLDNGKYIGFIKISKSNKNPPYVIKETCGKKQ